MSITDELRKWVRDGKGSLLAIADRIDAEHEAKVSYWQGASHKDGYDEGFKDGYDEGFASADDWLGQHDDAMAEHGWIRLPVDADGEYIHIGDVMEGVDKYDSLKEVTGEVTTISFDATFDPDDSRSVGIRVWSDDRRSYHTAYLDPRASVYRHYHAPTVEDVLREFALAVCKDEALTIRKGVVEEFAAKLRLAEEDA